MRETMTNRTCFKIISFILIQTFLVLDICWAANGKTITYTLGDATLAPSIAIDKVELELSFLDILDDNTSDGDLSDTAFSKQKMVGTMSTVAPNSSKTATPSNSNNPMIPMSGTNNLWDDPVQPPPTPSPTLDFMSAPVGTMTPVRADDEKRKKTNAGVIGFMDAGEYHGINVVSRDSQIKEGDINPIELGLPVKETVKLFRALAIIGRSYSDEKFWPGFIKFSIGVGEKTSAVMQLDENDNTHLMIIEHAIPGLIKLMEESPRLFRELIEAIFVHEGGKSGHGN
jgi:hypothetical protein